MYIFTLKKFLSRRDARKELTLKHISTLMISNKATIVGLLIYTGSCLVERVINEL